MGTSRKPYAFALGAALLLALVSPAAKATTTYTYTGNDFSFASASPYTTSQWVSASFTFSGPLAVSSVLTDETATLITWSITVGDLTWSPSQIDSPDLALSMAPDSSGGLTEWDITAVSEADGEYDQVVQTVNIPSEVIDYSFVGLSHDPTAYVSGDPGVWAETTTAAVPEPNSIVLAIIGGIALLNAAGGRRRTGS
jgi:hypothetical protein